MGKSNKKKTKKKKSHRISEHFSKKDFVCKCESCAGSFRISLGLVGALELLRTLSKNRVTILKGYECIDSKEKSGSFRRNYHSLGVAANITVENVDPKEVFRFAEQIDEFKGLGLNLDYRYVHVDTRKDNKRTCWVTVNGNRIELTDENRKQFLEPKLAPLPPLPDEPISIASDIQR